MRIRIHTSNTCIDTCLHVYLYIGICRCMSARNYHQAARRPDFSEDAIDICEAASDEGVSSRRIWPHVGSPSPLSMWHGARLLFGCSRRESCPFRTRLRRRSSLIGVAWPHEQNLGGSNPSATSGFRTCRFPPARFKTYSKINVNTIFVQVRFAASLALCNCWLSRAET